MNAITNPKQQEQFQYSHIKHLKLSSVNLRHKINEHCKGSGGVQ